MNLLKEQLNGTAEMKQRKEFYSQLFIASTIEAETMSNRVRKFNELHKVMNFFVGKFSLAVTILYANRNSAQNYHMSLNKR